MYILIYISIGIYISSERRAKSQGSLVYFICTYKNIKNRHRKKDTALLGIFVGNVQYGV